MSIAEQAERLNKDPYLCVVDSDLGILSVFDDLRYDRSDADLLSPKMRTHAINLLKKIGYTQKTGTVLVHKDSGEKCLIPKFHALGASPFDITRYTPKDPGDFYLLTPTQAACLLADNYPLEEAVQRIEQLIGEQPINVYKIRDYLERKPKHQDFLPALGYLKKQQAAAIAKPPLSRRRALG